MEITKEQIKELVKIAQAIDSENRIDDDVTGGYVEEPYKSIIERIYAVVNECEGKELNAGENTLPIHGVIARFSDKLIDSVIHELNAYGHNYDHYEFGLPTYDEHMDNMRNIVKVKLNGL